MQKQNIKKNRLIDGIFLKRRNYKRIGQKKKKIWWVWLLVIVLFSGGLFGTTKLNASYVQPNVNLLSLFGNGKFLILFQNNSEIRSSGGFIGSYAVADIENYKLKNLDFNSNIYALDNEFTNSNFIDAPSPLDKFLQGKSWALRDANFDASFTDAAADISQFYNWETSDQIDGIIALNAQVIVDLLKITGPIKLDKYDLTIDADNFYEETQYKIEREYFQNPENWVINEPKTFLKDLYPLVLEKAMTKKLAVFGLLKSELEKKEIVLNFHDGSKQAMAESQNWAGKIPGEQELRDLFATAGNPDYLYTNSNSFSGNKSSISIRQDLDYKISETDDYGPKMIQVDLKISRTHGGSYDWPDGRNTEYLRIYTNSASQFISANVNGKDISSVVEAEVDAGKNYFGYELSTDPGQANILELTYLIPYNANYNLLVQKQPGVENTNLSVNYLGAMLFDGALDRDIKIAR